MSFLTWRQQLGDPECPYAERWVLDFGPLGSIRLHHWFRSDDKRAKHDHPSDFITFVLKGEYTDLGYVPHPECDCKGDPSCIRCNTLEHMGPGSIARRRAEHRHTVAVYPGGCWTLLYFWPERREWGFWTPRKDTGRLRFRKHNKYFYEHGHHPCDQP